MNDDTKRKVFEFLKESVKRLTDVDYSIEELQKAYPFHSLFFRGEAIIAFKRQRSIVTTLGQRLYPKLARMIAEERFKAVRTNEKFLAEMDGNAVATIERIVSELREGQRAPDHAAEIREIMAAKGGKARRVVLTADIFIGDFTGGPFFAEIKSPLPNLDVAAESKKKLLTFLALFRGQNPRAYLAFPYNPFLRREDYDHRFTKRIMDMERQVLIGNEFWDKIGGPGTYDELMDIIDEVKRRTPIR